MVVRSVIVSGCSISAAALTWLRFELQWMVEPAELVLAVVILALVFLSKSRLQRVSVGFAAALVGIGMMIPYQPIRVGSAKVPGAFRSVVVYDHSCLPPDTAFECEHGGFLIYSRHLSSPIAILEAKIPLELTPQAAVALGFGHAASQGGPKIIETSNSQSHPARSR